MWCFLAGFWLAGVYMLIDQKSRQNRRITAEPGAVASPEKRVD